MRARLRPELSLGLKYKVEGIATRLNGSDQLAVLMVACWQALFAAIIFASGRDAHSMLAQIGSRNVAEIQEGIATGGIGCALRCTAWTNWRKEHTGLR